MKRQGLKRRSPRRRLHRAARCKQICTACPNRLCHRLSREGHELPERERALDRNLTKAVVKPPFDNLPV
ncbi:MAG: hypothetical protein B7X55_07805 [Rhodobacterales bacterium 34-62-10]|nr:MAG: hypothetical protein B7X55_07805 [Rhodobacterales bacterium 34-62-10]